MFIILCLTKEGIMYHINMKNRKISSFFSIFIMGLLFLFYSGCSRSYEECSDCSNQNISGVVQKGMFIDGTLTAQKVETNGSISGIVVTESIDEKGKYTLTLPWKGLTLLSAEGNFFNEYTGENSTDMVKLYALVDIDSQEHINLNLLTSLEYSRVVKLMQEGSSFKKAQQETKQSLETLLGLSKEVDAFLLNIYDLNSTLKEENKNLLLLSGTFLKIINQEDSVTFVSKQSQKGYFDGLDRFYRDFSEDGKIDGLFRHEWKEMIEDDVKETWDRLLRNLELENQGDYRLPEHHWARHLQLDISTPELIFTNDAFTAIEYRLTIPLANFPLMTLNGQPTMYTINYNTTNGTAIAGTDYTSSSGQLTFTRDANTQIVHIPILKQSSTDKLFTLNLSTTTEDLVLVTPNVEVNIPSLTTYNHVSGLNITQLLLDEVVLNTRSSQINNGDEVVFVGSDNSEVTLRVFLRSTATLRAATYGVNIYAIADGQEPLLIKENGNIHTIGRYTRRVGSRIVPTYIQEANIDIAFTEGLKTFLAEAYSNNKAVKFKAVARVQEGTTLTEVTKESEVLPKLVQIAETMEPHTKISQATYHHPLTNNCQAIENNDFTQETQYASIDIAGTYRALGTTQDIGINYTNACIQLTYNSSTHQFDPVLLEGVGMVTAPISVDIGGNDIDVFVSSIDRTAINVDKIVVNLPLGHGIHELNEDNKTISVRGENSILLENPTNNVIEHTQNMSGLSFGGTLDKKYLHANNLPLYFELKRYSLDSNGLVFDNTQAKYVFDYANRTTNNSERFKSPVKQPVSLTLTQLGIGSNKIYFDGLEKMESQYPRLSTKVGSFNIELSESKIKEPIITSDNNIKIYYDKKCKAMGCPMGEDFGTLTLNDVVSSKMYANGSSTLKQESSIGAVSWGNNGQKVVFKRSDDVGAEVYIPGFELPTNSADEISTYLLGTIEERESTAVYHKIDDETTQKGDYLFAGVNVGKLRIEGLDASTSDGIGLEGKSMTVVVGDDSLVLNSNNHSKYYLRPAGVTGVFNRRADAFSATVYGYDMQFSQFAFRQVENSVDEYSMIDGAVYVPNKGDFTVAFNSLGLDCRGGLNDGFVAPCDASVDTAPNCSERLLAWNMSTDFSTIGFEGDGECQIDKKLSIGHILNVVALKDRVGMKTTWTSNGLPTQSEVTSSAYNQMDGLVANDDNISNGGYDIAFGEVASLSSSANDNTGEDWLESNVTVGLPFWDESKMSIRLTNASVTQREPSVVTKQGELFSGTRVRSDSNEALIAKIKKDYKQTVNYSWAGGLIKFGLPVYYNSMVSNNEVPRFLGRTLSTDLKVMEAKAGIDYIVPDGTSMSFGASADFEALGRMKLHIDLNDPSSLSDMDDVFEDLHITNARPLTNTIGVVVDNIRIGNKLLNQGMTLSMEKGALIALREASQQVEGGDPFEKIAKVMAEVYAVPTLINDRIEREVKGKIFNHIDSAFNGLGNLTSSNGTYAEFAEAHNDALQSILSELELVDEGIENYDSVVDALNDLNVLLGQIEDVTDSVTTIKTTLNQYFKDSSGTCSWNYTANQGFFKPVGKATKSIKEVNQKLQDFDVAKIKSFAKKVDDFTGLDSKDLVSLANKIKKMSDSLNNMVNTQSGLFETQFSKHICTNVDTIQTTINEVVNRTKGITDIVTKLQTTINNDILPLLRPTGNVGKVVVASRDFSGELRERIQGMYDNKEVMLENTIENMILSSMSNNFLSDNEVTDVKTLKEALVENVNSNLNLYVFAKTRAITTELQSNIPLLTADDMRSLLVTKLFSTEAVQALNRDFQVMVEPIADEVNKIAMSLLGGIDKSVNKLLTKVSDKVNKTLNKATSKMKNAIPVKAAKMDGYAIIQGDRLAQAHIGSEFEVKGANKKTSFTLNAALDMWNDDANDTTGCSGGESRGNLNAQISTRDISMPLGEKKLKIDLALLGVTINGDGLPIGIFGAITSKSGFDFESLKLYNLGLGTGIGQVETYLAARANAKLDDVQLGVQFMLGKVCNQLVIKEFVPKSIEDFITIPQGVFRGALVYGEAQMPVWKNGCMLTVNVRGKVGVWYLIGDESDVYGGLIGGGASGKGLCIATLSGDLEALIQQSAEGTQFKGSGWGAAGVGSCDNSWSSVRDSRSDSWCGTGDAQFAAEYNNGWTLLNIDFSAVH